MTRLQFFLSGLFGGVAAGQAISTQSQAVTRVDPIMMRFNSPIGIRLHWFEGKALNGQCPVCGTLAETWEPEFYTVYDHYEPAPQPGDTPGMYSAIRGIGPRRALKSGGPLTRPITCQKCSNIFEQKAEEGKP
jgi:hypothetical protein